MGRLVERELTVEASSERVKKAVHLLLFKRGKLPGAKEWELNSVLGAKREEVLKRLDSALSDLDMELVKIDRRTESGLESEDTAGKEFRYVVRLKGTVSPREARLIGWRIDNLAALTMALAFIVSKEGKVERSDLEKVLAIKMGKWKSITLVEVFLRTGYLEETADGLLTLGWRAKAEVDVKGLVMSLASVKVD